MKFSKYIFLLLTIALFYSKINAEGVDELQNAISTINKHVNKTFTLSATQVNVQSAITKNNDNHILKLGRDKPGINLISLQISGELEAFRIEKR